MAVKSASFEVHIFRADHWVVDQRFATEEEACDYAERLLQRGRAEGIKVVRDWKRPDGSHVETELLTRFRKLLSSSITVPAIDEAPMCSVPDDYYRVESRITIGRVLRSYLDAMVLTPTELLHSYTELRRLLDAGVLASAAIHRVAIAQSTRGGDVGARREELGRIVDAAAERARRAANLPEMAQLRTLGFATAFDQLTASVSPDDVPYLAQTLLCDQLVPIRNWMSKVDRLLALIWTDGLHGIEPMSLLDAALADVIGTPALMQELLGPQRTQAGALCRLADLAEGVPPAGGRGPDTRTLHLCESLASGGLLDTRTVILDLLRRQLRGSQPLARGEPAAEREAFQQVLDRLTRDDGFLGGPGMAEALTLRTMRFFDAGGTTGRRQAIAEMLMACSDPIRKLRYLLVLAGAELGQQQMADIVAYLAQLTADPAGYPRFVGDLPAKTALGRLTRLYGEVLVSRLPEDERADIAANIDALLACFITERRIVEEIDRPDLPLRTRANQLLEFCAPGVLKSERALQIMRRRVVDHLRRPNFDALYVADLPDDKTRQRVLRDFYGLLGKAGFI